MKLIKQIFSFLTLNLGDSGGSTNTIQKSDPWGPTQPYLTGQSASGGAAGHWQDNGPMTFGQNGNQTGGGRKWIAGTPSSTGVPGVLPEAAKAYQNTGFFPGQTYANFDPATNQALQMQQQRAMNGSPLVQGSQQNLTDTANGAYLNSNPWLGNMFNAASQGVTNQFKNAVAPGIDSQFEAGGRYGSNQQQTQQNDAQLNLGTTLGNLASNIYGGNYQAERQRQLGAAALAPTLANQDYTDTSQLGAVGAARQNQQQLGINEAMQRQQSPWDYLTRYSQLVNGTAGMGGTSSQQNPYFTNPLGQGLGLGVSGLGLYNGLGQAGLLGGSMGTGAAANLAAYTNMAAAGTAAAGAGGLLATAAPYAMMM